MLHTKLDVLYLATRLPTLNIPKVVRKMFGNVSCSPSVTPSKVNRIFRAIDHINRQIAFGFSQSYYSVVKHLIY